jgi:Mn2+/Fe2+ NRAMP family transporter
MLGTPVITLRAGREAGGNPSKIWGLLKTWGPAWLVMIADVWGDCFRANHGGDCRCGHWGRDRLFGFRGSWNLVVPMLTLNLVNLALSLMVLQIVVLLAPAITLGLIASNERLMGRYSLDGSNRILYWTFLVLILGTGVASLVYSL